MTGPLLIVLHLIPQSVLAGLFFVMGLQALASNGITLKLLFLFRDTELLDPDDPLARPNIRKQRIWLFVALELLVFAATFAITQTIAAIGFPVIIIASIPFRTFVMPKFFRDVELRALDAPTAGSFVMESVGGAYGENGDEDDSGSTTPDVGGDESAVVDDAVERGESYELKDRVDLNPSMGEGRRKTKRRTTGSSLDVDGPEGMRNRSRSTRG